MFVSKRVSVEVGDVFSEKFFINRKKSSHAIPVNLWVVNKISKFGMFSHAELLSKKSGSRRIISTISLELQEHYSKITSEDTKNLAVSEQNPKSKQQYPYQKDSLYPESLSVN